MSRVKEAVGAGILAASIMATPACSAFESAPQDSGVINETPGGYFGVGEPTPETTADMPQPPEWAEKKTVTVPPQTTTPEAFHPTTSANEAIPKAQDPAEQPEQISELLQGGAPVHFIFVPSGKPPVGELLNVKKLNWNAEQLQKSSAYTSAVKKLLASETHGLYKPAKVTVEQISKLSIAKCLDNTDTEQNQRIQEHIAPHRQDGAINVAVIDQRGCGDVMTTIGGYAAENQPPIMARNALGNTNLGDIGTKEEWEHQLGSDAERFASAVIHEMGHSAGNDHAGVLGCENTERIEDCEANPTGDPNSVMSYTNALDADDFTAPELFKMGLIGEAQVINNPKSGSYELSPAERSDDSPKLITLQTANRQLFLSWEPDATASYDVACKPESKINEVDQEKIISLTSRTIDGEMRDLVCFKTDERDLTHSLQLRTPAKDKQTGEAFLALVQRDRAAGYSGQAKASGEVIDNSTVYKDDSITIEYIGVKNDGSAIVKIIRSDQ